MKHIKKWAVAAASIITGSALGMTAFAGGLNVNYRTQREIYEYMQDNYFDIDMLSEFEEEPEYSTAPYSPGRLTMETQQNALNCLNTIRFIAGIDEVELSEEYSRLAQAGCLVNAVNDKLTHYPDKPSDMSQELYNESYVGASGSNISKGYYSIGDTVYTYSLPYRIIKGWMSDSSASNISVLGHRRWCINPKMSGTGFGQVGYYYSMYSIDEANESAAYSNVAWPAQQMPLDLFKSDDPWSVSVGYELDISKISVCLEREKDGARWIFSEDSSDGFFNVDNSYCGQIGCIIFRPEEITYSPGDVFLVTITGLGSPLEYSVEFFEPESLETEKITVETLTEIVNFVLGKDYISENVRDVDNNGVINAFDIVLARRELIK